MLLWTHPELSSKHHVTMLLWTHPELSSKHHITKFPISLSPLRWTSCQVADEWIVSVTMHASDDSRPVGYSVFTRL